MSQVAFTGNDSIVINNRPIVDLPDGDVLTLTFPNDIMGVKTGKNGNTLFAFNESGRQAESTLRLMRGSPDDKFFVALFQNMAQAGSGFVLLQGQFEKQIGQGDGSIVNDNYVLTSGVFVRNVDAKYNVEGDPQQGVSIWRFKWAQVVRALT